MTRGDAFRVKETFYVHADGESVALGRGTLIVSLGVSLGVETAQGARLLETFLASTGRVVAVSHAYLHRAWVTPLEAT